MSLRNRFSDVLRTLGSNQDIHVLVGILARSPDDPSLDKTFKRCSNTLELIITNTRTWELRKMVLERVCQNLPQL